MKYFLPIVLTVILTSISLRAQITYVDASSVNTQAVGGSPSPFFTASLTSDNLWRFRAGFGFDVAGNNGVYEKDGGAGGYGDAAQLVTTITVPQANTEYGVYVNFLSASNATWQIYAGVDINNLKLFSANSLSVENLGLTSVSGSNRNQLRGFIANATSDALGEIRIYIDDTAAASNSGRTWFDGVSYGPTVAQPEPEDGLITNDGVWTWFNDERAIWHNDKLYVGHVKRNGKIAVTQFDPVTNIGSETELSSLSQVDDHNNPALHVRPDGKILASYSRHNPDNFFSYRISANTSPSTIADWGAESTHGTYKHSYSNTYAMSGESDKIYSFTRAGAGWNPNWTTSADGGATWSGLQELVKNGGSSTRPYVRYSGNGIDAVDFIYTDGHPRNENNSIYHARIKEGNVEKSDGSIIKALSATPLLHDAATPERGTVVYQYSSAAQSDPNAWIPSARAWIWDVQQQKNGDPVIAFTVQKDNVTGSGWNHDRIYYYYARWTGTTWQKRFIAHAGRPLYSSEDDYAGGICIDPDRPNVVYISSNALNPFDLTNTSNVPLQANSRYEIWKGVTQDGGISFTWEAVTEDSAEDNIRPFVPKNHNRSESLLWLRGTYTTYTNYSTRVISKLGKRLISYDEWVIQNGITGAPGDDDDNDGESNSVEYYREQTGLDAFDPILKVAQNLDILIPKVPASSDLLVKLMISNDLDSWNEIGRSLYGAPFLLTAGGYTLDSTSNQLVVTPSSTAVKGFYRLEITSQ